MGMKVEARAILTAVNAVPFDSLSGTALFDLYEMAYRTDTFFKRFVFRPIVLPIATLCAIPFLAPLDILTRTLNWIGRASTNDRFSLYLLDVVSHIVSIVILPFRLLSFYFLFKSDAFYSIRHSPISWQHLCTYLLRHSSKSEFALKELQKMPLLDTKTEENMSIEERIAYRMGCIHGRFSEAKQYWDDHNDYWSSTGLSPGQKKAVCTAVEMNDPILWDKLRFSLFGSDHLFMSYLMLSTCVEQGADNSLDAKTKQKFQQKALDLLTDAQKHLKASPPINS